ncbi:MAG: hypothetical protein Q8O92_10960 [Candidatus Latescibacter sp.]|nr:hypothetical protein [Candidatus Latescibacter sp.]
MSNAKRLNSLSALTRREMLGASLAFIPAVSAWAGPSLGRKKIAAVITEYRFNSHADCIVTRLLEGYEYDGIRRAPQVEIVSMYTDQVPANDISRDMAAKHNVKIYPTIRGALTGGGGKLAVEGVVLIGEHGNYAWNIKEQHLYPRWYLYKQIIDVFRESGRTVPVFTDKHLSYDWDEAKWMYDQSRQLEFPLMAGSSLPLAWRIPPLELEMGAPVERAVAAFYGGKESYGFHLLESLECMVERRKGGETGIASVQCLEGAPVWEWTDANPWAGRLLECGLSRCPDRKPGSPRANVKQPILFIIEYRSGLQTAAYLLNGHIDTTCFAADIKGQSDPVSTQIWLQPGRPFSHFSNLVYFIEQMMVTGKPAYPVERTLLTTGALAALMESSYQKGKKLETPYLKIAYRAQKETLFNRGPVAAMEKKA